MRGSAHARGAVGAVVMTLAVTACGGAGWSGGGNGGAVLSSSWGDPQNPLEPANTNEVQGGKVLDMIFRGLKKYDPRTGRARTGSPGPSRPGTRGTSPSGSSGAGPSPTVRR